MRQDDVASSLWYDNGHNLPAPARAAVDVADGSGVGGLTDQLTEVAYVHLHSHAARCCCLLKRPRLISVCAVMQLNFEEGADEDAGSRGEAPKEVPEWACTCATLL